MTTTISRTRSLARAGWEALGTSVVLLVDDPEALATARTIVARELRAIDQACSRFRPDSDLQRANAGAGRFVGVDPLLIEAVLLALRAAALTDGDVDPTVGNALILAGYDRDWTLLERPDPADGSEDAPRPAITARVTPGWQAIDLDHERSAIRIPTGVRLDLGATAKAWVADRAAAAVHHATGVGSLIGLGGDIATAGAAPEGGWRVYVTDDHRRVPGSRADDLDPRRRDRDLQHNSSALAPRRADEAPHHRSRDRRARGGGLAYGERRRGNVPGREHRQHRRADPRREGPGVAGAAGAARAPGGRRRHRMPRRRVARGGWRVAMTPIDAVTSSTYWYLTRSTGAVALLLLTLSRRPGCRRGEPLQQRALAAVRRRLRCTGTSRCSRSRSCSCTSSRRCSTASRRYH